LYRLHGIAALTAALVVTEYQSISTDLWRLIFISNSSPTISLKAFTFSILDAPGRLKLQTPN
jgi:hypothetical protein